MTGREAFRHKVKFYERTKESSFIITMKNYGIMEWHIIEKLKTKKVKILIKNTSHQILSNSKH